ncbi:hypothetical protein C0989_005412 [Termitomyces sp. Mn162]|nr:hypothetical protein C0989_005412 [Termitomyces sp. Mn162]
MPNPSTDTNYFGPLTSEGPPPPQWAPGPAPGSMGQNPGGGPPNGGPPGGWGPAMDNFPPQHRNGNHYYYYYNAGPPPQTQNSQDNTRNALAWEGKLDIQKPKPFTSRNPQKWRIFLTQCLTMFQAKPITFQLESSQIKDVLRLTPKQTTYDGYKALITQVDQHYWEDHSKNTVPRTSWNTSSNTNWWAGATNGIQSSIPTNPANSTPRFPPGRGVPNTNRPLGQRPPAQLNAADLHDTPVPLDTNPNDHDNILDPANDQEALCANRIQDSLWIDVPEEMQEKQRKEGVCILCGLKDALDRGPDPDVFSAPATLLRTTVLAPDNSPAHLPSHSSTNLLLCTTLPFTDKPVPTLVNSGTTNNFVDKSLAALAPQPLRRLPAPIPLKLFDGDSTPAGDITHCLEMIMTFADGQQQEL